MGQKETHKQSIAASPYLHSSSPSSKISVHQCPFVAPNAFPSPLQCPSLRGCEEMGTASEPTQANSVKTASREVPVPVSSKPLRVTHQEPDAHREFWKSDLLWTNNHLFPRRPPSESSRQESPRPALSVSFKPTTTMPASPITSAVGGKNQLAEIGNSAASLTNYSHHCPGQLQCLPGIDRLRDHERKASVPLKTIHPQNDGGLGSKRPCSVGVVTERRSVLFFGVPLEGHLFS
jgi:hypothetical protein